MSAEFEARKHLGMLYDEHLQDDDDIFWGEIDIDEIHFDLKIEKTSSPKPSIEMKIYSPKLVYRYDYQGDLTQPFNLAMLYPIEPISNDN